MSICKTTRFVINKNQNNEFVFTIKKLGSVDAMPIHTSSVSRIDTISRTVEVIESSDGIAANSQLITNAIPGTKEQYEITVDSLSTMVNNTTYEIVINSTTINTTYLSATHNTEYKFLQAVKASIVANATINAIVDCIVDENKLIITHKTTGTSFTVNVNDKFFILQTQYASPDVPAVYGPAVAIPAVAGYKKAISETLNLNVVKYDNSRTPTSIKFKADVANINLITGCTLSGGYWILNNLSTESVEVSFNEINIDPAIEYSVDIETITEYSTGDTFIARVYKLDTGIQYGVDISTVANTDGNIILAPEGLEGKITLKLTNVYCTAMESAKGSAADRYYLKPGYRLAIECDTIENGKFTAKVPLVYVE